MGSQIKRWRQVAVYTAIVLGLTGCASDDEQSAPISSIGDNGSGNRGGMLAPPPQPSAASAPRARAVSQPLASPPVIASAARPAPTPAPVAAETSVTTRDGKIVYNRSYNSIPKGSYAGGNTYTVKRGDTLFYIAWITGNDFRELAERNHVPEPYSLNVGQKLTLGRNMNAGGAPETEVAAAAPVPVPAPAPGHMLPANTATSTASIANTATTSAAPSSGHMLPANANRGVFQSSGSTQNSTQTAQVDSQPTNAYSENSGKQSAGKMLPAAGAVTAAPATEPTPVPSSSNAAIVGWRWPTEGKIIDSFSSSEGGNKGIDIAGSRGQPVVATAGGRVVYAGNALRGYGNLIIIKHNDDYLSAYAHNETMLVREQQEVKAGQQIATMGSSGTSSVRLHFEIRYKGKSVNPLRFLPQR